MRLSQGGREGVSVGTRLGEDRDEEAEEVEVEGSARRTPTRCAIALPWLQHLSGGGAHPSAGSIRSCPLARTSVIRCSLTPSSSLPSWTDRGVGSAPLKVAIACLLDMNFGAMAAGERGRGSLMKARRRGGGKLAS